ncbi:MAG: bifunctional nuclease domain-containing protein [Candidatus Latescibacterota bacterium]|jgi:bifunctional DNase/RNase|tara:strand:- start:1442 stop:2137 length:696 start_codon:yes stop_codon:yes gene_type:complete
MANASLVEMIVVKVSPYLREDRPLVWLGEKDVDQPRLLPIAIGEFEAAAIQMQLEEDEPIRPISYDLLSSMLDRIQVDVRQIIIHTVRRSIYYAKVVVEKGHKIQDIDSRPSDAIALALRTCSPIFVARELLDKVGLEPLETEVDIENTLDRFYELEPQISEPRNPEAEATQIDLEDGNSSVVVPVETTLQEIDELGLLQAQLEQAVLCEEYEEAARLRDEIESLVNKSES